MTQPLLKQSPEILLIEKVSHRFKRQNATKQNSGLSICTDHIVLGLSGRVASVAVDDTNDIKIAIQRFKPKNVFIQAIWIRAETLAPIKYMFPDTKFYLHVHSNVPFLVTEGYATTYISSYYKLGWGVVFNNLQAYELFKNYPNTHYLPNIYNANFLSKKPREESNTIDVGCFGSFRPMKNHITQAMAAMRFAEDMGKTINFHVNFGRSEGGGEVIKKNILALFQLNTKHKLIDTPWKSHSDFISHMNQNIDINMQLSMSESFNIVAADSIAAAVPIIVSPEIDWVYPSCISYYSDWYDINRTMKKVLTYGYIEENREYLRVFNRKSIETWENFIYETGI